MPSTEDAENSPRIFVSYSWTSPEHQERVVALATRLAGDGIDVIIDVWDLNKGQDKYQFMERMVADPTVQRVLVISDRQYAEKADGRLGGVGTETQIISREIYQKFDQQKFIAIVTERDDTGQPLLPTFLAARVYIDMSAPEHEGSGYEEVLRTLYGRPVHQRPALGKIPSFLVSGASVHSESRAKLISYKDAIQREKKFAPALLEDYFEVFCGCLNAQRIEIPSSEDLDEQAFRSVEQFLPLRDEFVDLVQFVTRYSPTEESWDRFRAAFETMLGIRTRQFTSQSIYAEQSENISFLIWELFLYAIATMFRASRFDGVAILVGGTYLNREENYGSRGPLRSFVAFNPGFRLFDGHRKHRLRLRYYSVTGQMLRERAGRSSPVFVDLIQVDFFLFIRSVLNESQDGLWYPRTLVYAENLGHFELFLRASERRFFANFCRALGISDREELEARWTRATENRQAPHIDGFWGDWSRYAQLMNISGMGTI